MGIEIRYGLIEDCGTGISAPANAPLTISDTIIRRTSRAIEIRDQPSLLQSLGLPENTPPELLVEALRRLQVLGDIPEDKKIDALRGTPLFAWLGRTADAATIAQTIVAVHTSGLVGKIVGMIGG